MTLINYNADFYNPYANQSVTRDYLSVIESALSSLAVRRHNISRLVPQTGLSSRIAVTVTAADAARARKLGYGKVILWAQGLSPEESFLRHHSYLRYLVLSAIEKKGLGCADFVFLVSDEMKAHFERKYRMQIPNAFVMPCFNEEMDREQFLVHDYNDNVFIYAGTLAAWQCFEQTVRLYKQIEETYGNIVRFLVLTQQQKEAETVLKKYGIKNYSTACVRKEQVRMEMAKAKFGFCIREDTAVNRAATPTKLSSYVCNGVIPVYSSCLRDFHRRAQGNPYCLCVDDALFWEKLWRCMLGDKIEGKNMFHEFQESFGRYYSKNSYAGGGNCTGAGQDIVKSQHSLKLSVIVPAYNMQDYLERCVMSLLKQGGIEMEIIIVNDGSQDNTCKTAQSLAGRFSNVRLVNQKNTGQYHARIHGVREAKGEYIAFTDADDFIKNGFYSSVMAVMEKEDADILEFGMMKIKGRKIISRFSPQMQVYDSREAVRRQLQKDGTVYSNGNKIYRCSLFQKIQFDEKIRYHEEDKLLNVKVMSIARKVMSIPDIGYIYDTRDESTTTRALTYDYLNVVKCSRAVYRYIKENRPEMSRMAARDLCAHLAFCYLSLVQMPEIGREQKRKLRCRFWKEFKFLYQKEQQAGCRPVSESAKRRGMLFLFSIHPAFAQLGFWIMNKQTEKNR